MINLNLAKLEEEGKSIKVGIVGAGKMGSGVICQIFQMKGMKPSIIADINLEHASKALLLNGVKKEDITIVRNAQETNDAITKGNPVITDDPLLLTATNVDVVLESTGVPEVGARVAHDSIMNGKHVVMLNVETDTVVGPILKRLADSAEVVYSIASGDQPGAIMEMYNWAKALGLRVVAAGRGTMRYPADREATPDDQLSIEQARSFGMENIKMWNSFRDGTKAQVEMASVANMTGLEVEVRGMHEPCVKVTDLPRVFGLKKDGGILEKEGVIELGNCVTEQGELIEEEKIFPGVFLVISTDHPEIRHNFSLLLKHYGGDGPNWVLYRHFHLVCHEVPISLARAVLYEEATGNPQNRLVSEVIALAKKDLKAGEVLDGGGGYTIYGLAESAEVARKQNLVPFELLYGLTLKQQVKKGTAITYDMVNLDENSFLLQLRRLQDSIFTS